MKILITGSRTWKNEKMIAAAIRRHIDAEFIFGDCPTGADAIAKTTCLGLPVDYEEFTADWVRLGGYAGPRRNQEMVNAKPDYAFAFRAKGTSRGTDDCVNRCRDAGIPVVLYGESADKIVRVR